MPYLIGLIVYTPYSVPIGATGVIFHPTKTKIIEMSVIVCPRVRDKKC